MFVGLFVCFGFFVCLFCWFLNFLWGFFFCFCFFLLVWFVCVLPFFNLTKIFPTYFVSARSMVSDKERSEMKGIFLANHLFKLPLSPLLFSAVFLARCPAHSAHWNVTRHITVPCHRGSKFLVKLHLGICVAKSTWNKSLNKET